MDLILGYDWMEVPYDVVRRDVKYPRLVFRGLKLLVILPHFIKSPEEVIAMKRAWIERKWSQVQEAIKDLNTGDCFMIFGEKYHIENSNVEKPSILHEGKKIFLNRGNRKHKEQVIKALKELLEIKLEEIITKYSSKTGLKPKKISIKHQKTLWGSCSSNGVINLNIKLVCLPENIIRYITFHELIHLKRRKHDKIFRHTISQEFPNYKEIEKELQIHWIRAEKLFQNLLSDS